MYGVLSSAATDIISGSAKPALTSLIICAPAAIAALAVLARIVSMLIGTPNPASSLITGITRAISSASLTRSAPGRVDSPPISIMSTPSEIISCARLTADANELCFPPSAKESGVTFKIPMIFMDLPMRYETYRFGASSGIKQCATDCARRCTGLGLLDSAHGHA
ncbi:unannotated protein [freshwater metagenome]|uniref:Unannotated protein n=1 Tax=freshwater metagenome TaxID=449393 RepID=A0A6J7HX49_9ZZZZ